MSVTLNPDDIALVEAVIEEVERRNEGWRLSDSPGSVERLRQAVQRFQAYAGPLRPHFAYGALSRVDFALAHTLHIANHQDEITVL